MICFFHRNSMTQREKIARKNYFQHEGMFLRYYNNDCVRHALLNTPNQAVLHLLQTQNAILFSPQIQVNKLMRLLKKTPEIILLSGIIDGTLMSYQDLINYSKLPSHEMMLAQVSHTLSRVASSITNNLSRPLIELNTNLSLYVKEKE